MYRARFAAILFVALCPSARADDVVLKSGRTLSGAIVKEDDKRVTLQCRGGEISIARCDIEEIRRSPAPAGTDAAPPAKKPEGAKSSGTTSSAPGPTPAANHEDAKTTARGLLDEMNAITLAAWVHEGPSVVTEYTIATYKIVAAGGSSKVTYTRPKSADGVAALYMLTRTADGRTKEVVDGVERWYWNRLYWSDEQDTWTLINPAETRFQRDADLAGRVTDACCRDEKARAAAYADAQAIARVLKNDRAATATTERAKLREDCALAVGSKEAGELLAQVLELRVDIVFAGPTTAKVALAMKRREALRRLVDAVGG